MINKSDNASHDDNEAFAERGLALRRQGYRLFAPLYDFVFGLSLQHGRRLAIDALDMRPGERILEIGVGSGMALPLYPADVSVIGIDISDEMLDKARHRVRRRKLTQVSSLLPMDVERMSFRNACFDKAVMMYSVSGFPDPARALAEVQRVCKPGATLVIANHFLSQGPLMRAIDILLAPIYRLLRYRADLDIHTFAQAANLEVLERRPANLFGYSTVLVCRGRDPGRQRARPQIPPFEITDAEASPATE